jgi:hypothetical protein
MDFHTKPCVAPSTLVEKSSGTVSARVLRGSRRSSVAMRYSSSVIRPSAL